MVTAYSSLRTQKYGVLRGPSTMTATERIQWTANVMQSPWIRLELKIFNDDNTVAWTGSNASINLAQSLGLKTLLCINAYQTGSTHDFVSADLLATYRDTIADILDTYPLITVIAIDNEELNQNYHTDAVTNIDLYVGMLEYAYAAAHPRNVKVANGGVGSDAAHAVIAYRWVVDKYGQATADAWAPAFMPTFQINAAKTPGSNAVVEALVSAMQAVMNSGYLDYINVHRYTEVDDTAIVGIPNMYRYIKEAMEDLTKLPYIINETGLWIDMDEADINETQAELWTDIMWEFYRLGVEHVQLWDGVGLFAIPFSVPNTGDLHDNGIAHRNFITRQFA